jgi:hypothetical protein
MEALSMASAFKSTVEVDRSGRAIMFLSFKE